MKQDVSGGRKALKIVFRIIIVLIILLLIAVFAGAQYLVKYAISPSSSSGTREVDTTVESVDTSVMANKEEAEGLAWSKNTDYEEMSVTSADNYKLIGHLYNSPNNEDEKYVILVHGYKSDMTAMYSYAKHYYDEGYSVLLIDLRAHGESEGKYIGMGWLDKDDLNQWINALAYKYPDAQIVLHGVSMGAATVLMTSGDDMSSNVKAIIEDCGYTSAYDIFSLELEKRFENIPAFPTMDIASVVCKLDAGYTFKEASALEQVKKSTTPTLFIHGTGDDFVPVDMANELYDAAGCEKELYIVEGAGHAHSKDIDPDKYFDTVFTFIDKYVKTTSDN